MSHFIQFDRACVRIPYRKVDAFFAKYKPEGSHFQSYGEDHFIVLTQGGDNNMIDLDGRIAREWQVSAIGPYYSIFDRLCFLAAAAERQLCRFAHTRRTKAGNYLAMYRKALKLSIPIEAFVSAMPDDVKLLLNRDLVGTKPTHHSIAGLMGLPERAEATSDDKSCALPLSQDKDAKINDLIWAAHSLAVEGTPSFSIDPSSQEAVAAAISRTRNAYR
jgi:hypothetical protein